MEKYDTIGNTYSRTRKADPRITRILIETLKLQPGAKIADIGAGTGNYGFELACRGYEVFAIEPSEVMRQQGKQHPRLHWMSGRAEEIPLENESMDGLICVLAIHHFGNLEVGFREMVRIVKKGGPIVIFAADPRLCPPDFWLADYFQPIFQQACEVHVPIQEVCTMLGLASGGDVDVIEFLLPADLQDQFFFSGWRQPELYLDPVFRSGISSLAVAEPGSLERCLNRLASDLKDGTWKRKYGWIMKQQEYDGGYRFLVARRKR